MTLPDGQLEWLESNVRGSFALGSVDRKLRRKYHALLTVRDPGRGEPWNVLAELLETVELEGQLRTLADPLGRHKPQAQLAVFSAYPHATHRYRLLDTEVGRTVRLGEHDQVEITYVLRNVFTPVRLRIAPLLRCRAWHDLTHENPFLDGACLQVGEEIRLLPYAGMPTLAMRVYGVEGASSFREQGAWIPSPRYEWDAARGYPAEESLFSPGEWTLEATADTQFTLVVGLNRCEAPKLFKAGGEAVSTASAASAAPSFAAKLERAAGQFFMRSQRGLQSVVAGFPWFGSLSRDTLLALPGLYLASSDYERAEGALEALANTRVSGLIAVSPALSGSQAHSASLEASLLFVRTVQWFAQRVGAPRVARFMPVVLELLDSLAAGHDPRMRFDQGVAVFTQPGPYGLTWMNAVVDGMPVTPRAGYAVDIDALAYNAAHFACEWADSHRPQFARTFRTRLRGAEAAFLGRYWDDARGHLADAHNGWRADASLRPNQLWALGLPYRPIHGSMARSALNAVTRELLVPVGVRTLSPREPAFKERYAGSPAQRDRAYHQGSAWPWLLGIYADAVLAQHDEGTLHAQLGPILARLAQHLDGEGCIGQLSELFDGQAPHAAGGAPAQAFSVAEVLRAFRLLHASEGRPASLPRAGQNMTV